MAAGKGAGYIVDTGYPQDILCCLLVISSHSRLDPQFLATVLDPLYANPRPPYMQKLDPLRIQSVSPGSTQARRKLDASSTQARRTLYTLYANPRPFTPRAQRNVPLEWSHSVHPWRCRKLGGGAWAAHGGRGFCGEWDGCSAAVLGRAAVVSRAPVGVTGSALGRRG